MVKILLAVLFRVLASVFIKLGADTLGEYSVINIITNFFYIGSLCLLFMQAISWQLALKEYDLNHAYLYMSLYYPIILIVCFVYFNEDISFFNILGVLLILSGVVLSLKKTRAE